MTEDDVYPNEEPAQTSLSLLQRVQQNDDIAWQKLVDLYAPLIYSRCRFHWKFNPADAESIGQEVFAAVARKIKAFKRQRAGSFRKWLRTITDNKCKDFVNRKSPGKAIGGSDNRQVLENVAIDTINQEDTKEELDDRAIVMRQAMKAVENEFSARDWKIFWAISVDNKHRQHVAEDLGVTENVVYLAYSRIRRRLREIYEDLIDDDLLQ